MTYTIAVAAIVSALIFSKALTVPSATPPTGWDEVLAHGWPVEVSAQPVAVTTESLSGVSLAGSWALTSDDPLFGGFSDLDVDNDRLYAVSDQGRWLSATMTMEGGALHVVDAVLAPMRDTGGINLDNVSGDAEALTRRGSAFAVAFERFHRVMLLTSSGELAPLTEPGAFERFPENQGIEALATLPSGDLLALSEFADDQGVSVMVIGSDGDVREVRFPFDGPRAATAAEIGPDGRLYVLMKVTHRVLGWSLRGLFGRSIRLLRFELGPDGFPRMETREILATFEGRSGTDNLEGLAIDGSPAEMTLWLISDDNMSRLQGTHLIRLSVHQ